MLANTTEAPAPDMEKLEHFAHSFVSDLSASFSGVMALVGHELGLYKALQAYGPLTSRELAESTNCFERYVREWLNNQTAGGYVLYNPEKETFELPLEHAMVLVQQDSPVFMAANYYVVDSIWQDREKLTHAFRSGEGIGWHEHHHNLFHGVEAMFKSGYQANLTNVWIPALDGLEEKLISGGRIADIGCGHGASAILMAEKYPNTMVYGYDYHKGSIDVAKQRAEEKGLTNIIFTAVGAEGYAEDNFDLICFFDCFHDLGNPLEAVRFARTKLNKQGSLMVVEPFANDKLEDNINPISRMFYAGSTALCVPHSHSEDGDFCLGAQAGPSVVEEITRQAGYSKFRIAEENPVNLIYEVKI